MSNIPAEPPDDVDDMDGNERATPEEECEIDGHAFEGYDTVSEICAVCGLIRDYASKSDPGRRPTRGDEIHTCMSAADHAFGLKGKCMYCGKSEAALTQAERELHQTAHQQRRDASQENTPASSYLDDG
jgi:hypothetical protein